MSRDAAMQVLATVDRWGGMPASIRCLLGHRKHFKALRRRDPDGAGWLNWCLWMDPDKPEHKLTRLSAREVATNTPLNSATHSNIYSGYIWKCFTLQNWYNRGNFRPEEIFFIWQHTNFASEQVLDYHKEILAYDERMMRRHIMDSTQEGNIVLLAKSSGYRTARPDAAG